MELSNLQQWLNNGGTLKIENEALGKVLVCVGDPGGVPQGNCVTVASSKEALEWAEEKAKKSIESQLQVVSMYKSGEIEWPSSGEVLLPGVGLIKKGEV